MSASSLLKRSHYIIILYPPPPPRPFPYISAMVNNGSVNYDHGKDGRASELGGCSAEIRNREHDTYLAIRYSRGRLTVRYRGAARQTAPVSTDVFFQIMEFYFTYIYILYIYYIYIYMKSNSMYKIYTCIYVLYINIYFIFILYYI